MRKIFCFLLCLALILGLGMPVLASGFTLDAQVRLDGMDCSWYQGYAPVIQYHTMDLYLPLRAEGREEEISVCLTLDDPNVFLLASQPKAVSVTPKEGVYPVKLRLPLERSRRNGDYPATVTVKNAAGEETLETIPYIIRIRDGYGNHETLTPEISNVAGNLDVGSDGELSLTITNPTSTISLTDAVLTVTDTAGEVLMSGSNLLPVPEILPGRSETVTIPMTVKANAAISRHTFEVSLSYKALGKDAKWMESFTLPVTQAIRLEYGDPQLPTAIAGELADMILPLMNLGRGELHNVLVKLNMENAQGSPSVLAGTIASGETKQAKLTFTTGPESVGVHSGEVVVTCEDAYGNEASYTMDVSLTVEEPLPAVEEQPKEEKRGSNVWTIVLAVLCGILAIALVGQGVLLRGKLHKLEEERL